MEKNKKLSDELVVKMWNKKKLIGDNHKVFVSMNKNSTKDIEVTLVTDIKYTDPITMVQPTIHPQDELMKQYKRETGKNPIWRGKVTKAFFKWVTK